jgi:hypothetical protein
MREPLRVEVVEAGVVLNHSSHQGPRHEVRPDAMIKSTVRGATKHVVRHAKLVDVP